MKLPLLAKKTIMMPIWFLQLFSTAKSFNEHPIIGNRLMNRMGLHVLRIVVSHSIMNVKIRLLAFGVSREDRLFYKKHGYLLKTQFLEDDHFQKLRDEAENYTGECRKSRQGNTLTQRSVMSPEVRQTVPAINDFLDSAPLRRLARFTAGNFRAPFFYIENVKNHHVEGEEDPQKRFHTDTFHPTMKCWFFIDDVTAEKGPFTFIPGSNRLSFARLKIEYKKSVLGKEQENRYAQRGSMRFSDSEIEAMNLAEPIPFIVPPNTLVIANTFGIHKRMESGKSTRLSIYGDSRTNPFMPVPGVPSRWVNEMQYSLLDLFRKKRALKHKN